MKIGLYPKSDFEQRPLLVIWETTRACDLACQHCRAEAISQPEPDELCTEEAEKMIREISAMRTPLFIFSGGDCLKRSDLEHLIALAKSLGLKVGAIPAATDLVTESRLQSLKKAGLDQIAFSLDSASKDEHDRLRGVEGTFERALKCIQMAHRVGLRVQINSLVNVHSSPEAFDALAALVEGLRVSFWEIFFLVPTGRGQEMPILKAEDFENMFGLIEKWASKVPFVIKVTEAPHYRRYVLEKRGMSFQHQKLPLTGVNAGKGFLFVSRTGDIMPSGFLPIVCGNVRKDALSEVYRHSPIFVALRDSRLLKGRCGYCPYREVCGGSRARAFALTKDMLAEDPACCWEPVREQEVWENKT